MINKFNCSNNHSYQSTNSYSNNAIFNNKYYREFPSNDSPEVLEYLIKKNISTVGYTACILNIIYKNWEMILIILLFMIILHLNKRKINQIKF